jgi:hypothetical protein
MTDEIPLEDYAYVLGNDPGQTTGIAMLRYTEDTPAELVYLSQLPQGMKGYFDFFEGSRPTDNVTIVSESFVNRPGIKSPDVTPLRIEGIQYSIWGDEVEYQTPDMKALVPDQVLKDNNLWTPGKRHQMDALIHALVWLRNQGHKPTLEALSGKAEQPIAEPGEAKEKTLPGPTAIQEVGEAAEDATAALEKFMAAFSEMYGGDEPERQDPPEQKQQEGQGEGEAGEADGEAEGEPTGSGGAGQEMDEVPDPELDGQRRRRVLNGSFIGFDED